jgi:hypothetical protein
MSGMAEPNDDPLAQMIREQIHRPENIRYLRSLPAFAASDELPGQLQALFDQLALAEAGKVPRHRIWRHQDGSANTCREDFVAYAGTLGSQANPSY